MSRRSSFALLLSALLLALCAAPLLFRRDAQAAIIAFAFALAGALVARLFPTSRAGTTAGERDSSFAHGDALPAKAAARDEPARATAGKGVAEGALFASTLESLRDGVLVVDAWGAVTASNQAAREMFGVRAGVRGGARRLSEWTRHPSIHAAFGAALERGERAEVRVELRAADTAAGSCRVFDLRVAPLGPRGAGAWRGAVGLFFDTTRLEQLERVRQEFLSNVSHELRTPLAAVLTYVETLEAGGGDDAAQRALFLAVIRRNAERMRRLVEDIGELSLIESGAARLDPRPARLRALVEHVFTALRARAEERRVELRNEVEDGATVYADPSRLEQMLTNLADNAVKFNREGGAVTITHGRAGRADRVSVADTGEGLTPEHASRVFERFYRVERARTREAGGTGLGLAIVKHLARAHGGEVSVESTPGAGSVFTIELPAAPNAAPGAKPEESR